MILTMIDAENRMQVLKYDGEKLEELATLKMVTVDRIEMAQIAATLALMAGEGNGSTPPRAKAVVKAKPKALPPAKRDKNAARAERRAAERAAAMVAKAREAAPPKEKRAQARKLNPDYTPDLLSNTGKVLLVLEAFDREMTAPEIGDEVPTIKRDVLYATLQGLAANLGVLDRTSEKREGDTRPVSRYRLSQHGRDSIARSRAASA